MGPQVPHSFVYHDLVAVGVEQPEAPAATELVELIHAELVSVGKRWRRAGREFMKGY